MEVGVGDVVVVRAEVRAARDKLYVEVEVVILPRARGSFENG